MASIVSLARNAVARLLGPQGEPVDPEKLQAEEATAELTGIRQILSAHPSIGLTPERLAVMMREAEEGNATRYLELAEDMEEKDLHYLAVLGTRKRQVAQLDVTVESASDDPNDEANATLVRDLMNNFAIEDVLFDMLDAVGKGYSATEIMWDMSELQWFPKQLVYRDPRWFGFDRVGGKELMLRVDMALAQPNLVPDQNLPVNIGLQRLTPYKYIVHFHKAKSGLPIRGGLARAAGWAYLFRNMSLKDWVVFAEVYGQPLRVGKYNPGASDDEKSALLRAVANIGSDAAAIIPTSMVIDFVEKSAKGDGGQVFQNLCTYLEQQLSKAVLGQTSTTDATPGSHAIGRTHDNVRGDIERSDAGQLSNALNLQLIRPYVDLNRGPQKLYPRVKIGRSESVDITANSTALGVLVPLGLRILQSEVRGQLGYSDPAPDAEILKAPAPPQPMIMHPGMMPPPKPGSPPGPGSGKNEQPAEEEDAKLATNAALDGAPAPRDTIDVMVDKLAQSTAPAQQAMLVVIKRLIENAGSMQEVAEGLAKIYPAMKADELAAAIRQAMALADVVGRADLLGDQATPAA